MAKTGPKSKIPAKPERVVYCGPNIPGGALQQYTIFKGGLPGHLDSLFASCPAVKALCVPVENLQVVREAVKVAGSMAQLAYEEIMDYIKKGGKK